MTTTQVQYSLCTALDFEDCYFTYISLGTVIANLLVFYVIEYIGAGFAIVCSYFND